MHWLQTLTKLADMSTSLKYNETTGIIAGALVFVGACIVGGVALGLRGNCRRRHQAPYSPLEHEPVDHVNPIHISAIQLARELAYQKAVNELDDYFENDNPTPEAASAHVRKTLDFLAATLNAIG